MPGLYRSSSNAGGLIPRAPTGSDWARSGKGDRNSVGLAEILKDLDRQAGYVLLLLLLLLSLLLLLLLLLLFMGKVGAKYGIAISSSSLFFSDAFNFFQSEDTLLRNTLLDFIAKCFSPP